MGTSLTNIQMFVGGQNPCDTCSKIRDSLISTLSDSYELVQDGELATRTIFLAPSSSRWVSVYDQDSEMQEVRILRQLARSLSKTAKLPAVSVMVHDSDVLWIDFFTEGKKIDSYCNNVGALGEEGKGLPVKHEEGEPNKWKTLLLPGKTPKDLKQAWDGEYTFADEMLVQLSALFGVDGDKLGVGYNLLDSMRQPPSDMEKIHFRSRKPIAPKPPDFEFNVLGADLVCSVAPNQNVSFTVTIKNKGMTGTGIGIQVSGESEPVTHVKPIGCKCSMGKTLSEIRDESVGMGFTPVPEEQTTWMAEIPGFHFLGNPKSIEERLLWLTIEFHAESIGNDDLTIVAYPLENAERGYSQMSIGIRVQTPDP